MTPGNAFASRGKPVLTIRAARYGKLKQVVGNVDLGWRGDTAWDFSLSERSPQTPYRQTWAAGIQHENLNPAVCGHYEQCSRALASKVFAQLRRDGLIR